MGGCSTPECLVFDSLYTIKIIFILLCSETIFITNLIIEIRKLQEVEVGRHGSLSFFGRFEAVTSTRWDWW